MTSKGRVFKDTPESFAQMQPFVGNAPLSAGGVLLGPELKPTRRAVYFDPWMLKQEGEIHSTVFLVTGDKGGGKSTFLKALILRLMGLQAGVQEGQAVAMRARIHDRKPEDGEPEYKPVTDYLHSQVLSLNRRGSVNIFDPAMRMSELDLVETAANVCEMVSGRRLEGFETLALQVGVHKMVTQLLDVSCPEVLEVVTRSLTRDDVDAYYQAANTHLETQYTRAMPHKVEVLAPLKLVMSKPSNVPPAAFLHDAAMVSSYLGRILRGDFGNLFGGRNSLRSALSQPMVTFDWTGVNDNARTLLEAILWKWQEIALDRNDLSLIPHISMGDEEHAAVGNLMHMRFRSAYVKKARAFHTADFISTQHELDLMMAGDVGSEIYQLASGIRRGFGARFIARQPQDDDVLNAVSKLGISDHDVDFTTRLEPGSFGIKLPDRRIMFFQLILTETELGLVQTDKATERMLNRIPVNQDAGFIQRQAVLDAVQAELETVTVGEES